MLLVERAARNDVDHPADRTAILFGGERLVHVGALRQFGGNDLQIDLARSLAVIADRRNADAVDRRLVQIGRGAANDDEARRIPLVLGRHAGQEAQLFRDTAIGSQRLDIVIGYGVDRHLLRPLGDRPARFGYLAGHDDIVVCDRRDGPQRHHARRIGYHAQRQRRDQPVECDPWREPPAQARNAPPLQRVLRKQDLDAGRPAPVVQGSGGVLCRHVEIDLSALLCARRDRHDDRCGQRRDQTHSHIHPPERRCCPGDEARCETRYSAARFFARAIRMRPSCR